MSVVRCVAKRRGSERCPCRRLEVASVSPSTAVPAEPAVGVEIGERPINFWAHEVRTNRQGAREDFEQMIGQLVRAVQPGVKAMVVAANPGDWGIDVFVGELSGVVTVWQSKCGGEVVAGAGVLGWSGPSCCCNDRLNPPVKP